MTSEAALTGPQHFDAEGASPGQASLHTHPFLWALPCGRPESWL